MIQLLLLIVVAYKVIVISIENNSRNIIIIISSRKQNKNCCCSVISLLLTTVVFVIIRVVDGKRRLICNESYDRYQRHRLFHHHHQMTTTMMIIPKTTLISYRFITTTMKRSSRVNNGNIMTMIGPHYSHPHRISRIKHQCHYYHFTKQSIMFVSSSTITSLNTVISNCRTNEKQNSNDNDDRNTNNKNNNIVGQYDDNNQGQLKQHKQQDQDQKQDNDDHNFGFYLPYDIDKIERIKYVVAPMVAASDYPFRSLCRQYTNNNNILTFTQMLHAHKIMSDETFCINHFDFYECYNYNNNRMIPSQRALFDNNHNNVEVLQSQQQNEQYTNGPLIVQLAGNDPKIVVKAAHKILNHVTSMQQQSSSSSSQQIRGFDLNCGCPQDIARKGNYGAHLMEKDETIVYKILTELRNSIPNDIAISVKIRLPNDTKQLYNRINHILNTGIDFLTIHGRTMKENKTTVGPCHYDQIKNAIEIASNIRPNVPIIANGGIESYHDISIVQRITGANAIMSSEALLEYPQLFNSIHNTNNGIIDKTPLELLNQQVQFAFDYLQWCKCYPPLPGVLGNSMNTIRGHLFKLLHRYLNVTTNTNNDNHYDQTIIQIRNELASNQLRTIDQAQELVYRLYQFYSTTLHNMNDNNKILITASLKERSWYRRHWKKDLTTATTIFDPNNMMNYRNDFDGIIPTTNKQSLSLEERKIMIKNRIAILQDQKHNSNKKTMNTQQNVK